MSLGVVQYLLKPFVFATPRDLLEAYRSYRTQLGDTQHLPTQAEVDKVFAGVPTGTPTALPKGMSQDLLARVTRALRDCGTGAVPRGRVPLAGGGVGRQASSALSRATLKERAARWPAAQPASMAVWT